MSTINANTALQILRTELQEIESRILEGQVTYNPRRRMGRGSFGDVYRGQHEGTNVCVKVLSLKGATLGLNNWQSFLRVLKREVKTWRGLDHPNVVRFVGWMSEEGEGEISVSLISGWCAGGCVMDYLREHPSADRHGLICGVNRGLAYLHSQDIVHGDIKPANIVVARRGKAGDDAQLCDFGLSCILGDISTYAHPSSIAASIRYASPELLSGSESRRTKECDIWAFGCTSAEILTGQLPFSWVILEWNIPSIVNNRLPYDRRDDGEIWTRIATCFERVPEKRPSMEDLGMYLELALGHSGSEPLPTVAPGSCNPTVPISDGDLEGIASAPWEPSIVSDYSEIMNRAPSVGYIGYDSAQFCRYLRHSQKALDAYISSVELHLESGRIPHRYLILQVQRNDERTLYIRLDRRRGRKEGFINFALPFSTSVASDEVWISHNVDNLHIFAKKLERTMSFGKHVPFCAMAPLLEIVKHESATYRMIDENCWFFVSIVQEILALNFAGVFRDGKTLKHPGWAPDCRVAIKRRCYAETEILDQTPVATEDIKQLFNTMGDHDLRTTFGRVIDILLRQHRKLYESPFRQAKDHLQLSTAIEKVFGKLSLLSQGSRDMSPSELATGLETCLDWRESKSRASFFSRSRDEPFLFHEEVDRFLDSQLNTLV